MFTRYDQSLVRNVAAKWGIEISFIDVNQEGLLEKTITENTKMIWFDNHLL